jgi:hypothetical protein
MRPSAADGWRRLAAPAAWIAGTAAILLILFPAGFPNYDTIYGLVWGRELAHGMSPDYGSALPPTPHPLLDLLGTVTTPLGDGAITVTMVIAYAALGLIAYLVYRLGSLWFDRVVGAVAALIVLTRAPFLSNGLRAYVDLPYIALCLAALAVESRRPRAGWPVLALLTAAGLLRPEAWIFSFAYLAYLLVDLQRRPLALRLRRDRGRAEVIGLIALAAAAPLAWGLFDLITAGSATYSFTGTKDTVDTLGRQTGLADLVLYGPRRLGEVLQWPGVVGAAGGIALALAFMRRRALLGVTAAALALAAFALLAIAGLAIIPRYTMLAAAVLAIFCAAGLLGWRLLAPGHTWRRRWQLFAAVVAAMFVAWGPNQYDLLHRVDTDIGNQGTIEDDLTDLADSGAFAPLCGPISVPNHRAVPRLAFALDIEPTRVVSSSEQRQPRRGYFLAPASPFVIHNFILDPNDPARFRVKRPAGFRRVADNDSWILYRRC